MKLGYLQGKAALVASLELDQVMSFLQIPGTLVPIREIKVGPEIGGARKSCTAKVVFNEELYIEIAFDGKSILDFVHWTVERVVTHYHHDQYRSIRTY